MEITVGFLLLTSHTCTQPPTYTPTHTDTHIPLSLIFCIWLRVVCAPMRMCMQAHSARQLINGRGILLNVTMVTAVKLLHKRVDCSWGGWNKTGKNRGEEYENKVQERLKRKVGGLWMRKWKRVRVWRWEKRKCIGENEKQGASRSWKG